MRNLIAVVGLLLVGCGGFVTNVTEIPSPNFDASLGDYAIREGGTSHIGGSGFSRQRGGGVVSCAGNTVYLMPDTDFYHWVLTPATEQTVDTSFGFDTVSGTRELHPVDERLAGEPLSYVHTTSCDIDGRFEFANIPQGSYLVATVITWSVLGSGDQGGPVVKQILVDGEESIEATLTNVQQ